MQAVSLLLAFILLGMSSLWELCVILDQRTAFPIMCGMTITRSENQGCEQA